MRISIQGLYNSTLVPYPRLVVAPPRQAIAIGKKSPTPTFWKMGAVHNILFRFVEVQVKYRGLLKSLECLLMYGDAALGCVGDDFSETLKVYTNSEQLG